MKSENIYIRIIGFFIRIAMLIAVAVILTGVSKWAYGFGYGIFMQTPVSQGDGYTVTVTINESDSVRDIGKILKSKGLIKDDLLFYVQEKVSEHHGHIAAGTYDLSTAMTPEQMIEAMSKESVSKTESNGAAGNFQAGEALSNEQSTADGEENEAGEEKP